MAWLAAGLLALAVYLWATHDLLPSRLQPTAQRVRAPKPRPWTVTDRACELLGWSARRLRVWSWVFASGVGLSWALFLQDPLAGLPLGWIGYQLPGFFLELRAAHTLGLLQRQIGLFVGTVHDHLHARATTVEDALWAGSLAVHDGPLAKPMAHYREQVETRVSLGDRLTTLERAMNWPTVAFFFALLRLHDETGSSAMARAFASLTDKLHEDERIETTIRGELSLHLSVLLISWGATLAIFPYFRITSPIWPALHQHLSLLITLTGFGSAVVFSGVRKFARTQVSVGE